MKVYRPQPRPTPRAKEAEILTDLLLNPGDHRDEVHERAEAYLTTAGSLHALLSDPAAHELADDDHRRLLVSATVARRYQPPVGDRPPAILGPSDVVSNVADIRAEGVEHVVALYLDSHNRLIDKRVVSIGGLRASVIQPRDLLGHALLVNAASLALVHNHPSGSARPSAEDLQVTRQLVDAARLLGLELLDHVVVAEAEYTSLRELNPSVF